MKHRCSAARHSVVFTWVMLGVMSVAACGGDEAGTIGVEVSFETGLPRASRDLAVRVEVYLVDSCDVIEAGDRPDNATASSYALRDGDAGPILGSVAPGEYGLYAVAQDANCAVVAAGCDPITIGAETAGPLSVSLSGFSGTGCSIEEECSIDTGDCTNGFDGGSGGSGGDGGGVVNDCSTEPDLTACKYRGRQGLCRMGECCTDCWDGSACQEADGTLVCGEDGALCMACE